MAKSISTGKSISRSVRVGGRCRATDDGRASLAVDIDGISNVHEFGEATSQEAIYIATHKAIRKADSEGVTDLEIVSQNRLVKGHLKDGWMRRQSRLKPFQDDIEALIDNFDSVVWI